MDLPKPPEDHELKNIIDKLAQFVARNGFEFEQMTKQKQKDNPKFSFLFGGEYFNYYQYRNAITQQINEAQEQIRQSEQNLMAQHQVLMKQQQMMIDETIRKAQEEQLRKMAHDFNVNLNEFENVLQPIIETCTKDSISYGKSWIFTRCSLPVHYDIIAKYLLKRVLSLGQSFDAKLHLLYLINDLLNHCMRKGSESLKRSLEKVIIPIYCCAFFESDEEKQQRLIKLLKLWESNQYIDENILDAALCNEFSALISPITSGTLAKYSQLQKQHNEFVAHQTAKMQQLQQQPQVPQNMPISLTGPPVSSTPAMMIQNQPPIQSFGPQQHPPQLPSSMPLYPQMMPPHSQSMAPSQPSPMPMPPMQHGQHHPLLPQPGPPPVSMAGSHSQPPPFGNPTLIPPPIVTPTIQPTSVPNPQFFNSAPPTGPPPITMIKEIQPDVPYYELPAGLMVPLVKLEDFEYKAIDPKDIRLPPPAPPNERLLKAVEAFYSPPSHERPRNSEGWEQLGLYEFFRAKSQAMKVKDDRRSYSSEDDSQDSFQQQEHKSYRRKSHSPSPKRRYREDRSSYSNRDNKKIDESNKGHQLLKKMGWSGAGLGCSEQGIKDPVHGGDVRNKQDMYKGVGLETVDLNDPYEAFRKNKGQAFMHRLADINCVFLHEPVACPQAKSSHFHKIWYTFAALIAPRRIPIQLLNILM
ncbi:calcium homeostasis endoplasmic reticulum protein-like protein, partial [Dinothrombium tinctorium]